MAGVRKCLGGLIEYCIYYCNFFRYKNNRILTDKSEICLLKYDYIKDIYLSDHKPVYGLFELRLYGSDVVSKDI